MRQLKITPFTENGKSCFHTDVLPLMWHLIGLLTVEHYVCILRNESSEFRGIGPCLNGHRIAVNHNKIALLGMTDFFSAIGKQNLVVIIFTRFLQNLKALSM